MIGTGNEIEGSIGPFKGTVKGPLAVLVLSMAIGFGGIAWQINEGNKASAASRDAVREALLNARAIAKGEHDVITNGQRDIVRSQEDGTCMLALPPEIRPAAVQWTRVGSGTESVKWRSVCEYVVTVYLSDRKHR